MVDDGCSKICGVRSRASALLSRGLNLPLTICRVWCMVSFWLGRSVSDLLSLADLWHWAGYVMLLPMYYTTTAHHGSDDVCQMVQICLSICAIISSKNISASARTGC
jgi:hypothetical protein